MKGCSEDCVVCLDSDDQIQSPMTVFVLMKGLLNNLFFKLAAAV